jgi:hypothetical protein
LTETVVGGAGLVANSVVQSELGSSPTKMSSPSQVPVQGTPRLQANNTATTSFSGVGMSASMNFNTAADGWDDDGWDDMLAGNL